MYLFVLYFYIIFMPFSTGSKSLRRHYGYSDYLRNPEHKTFGLKSVADAHFTNVKTPSINENSVPQMVNQNDDHVNFSNHFVLTHLLPFLYPTKKRPFINDPAAKPIKKAQKSKKSDQYTSHPKRFTADIGPVSNMQNDPSQMNAFNTEITIIDRSSQGNTLETLNISGQQFGQREGYHDVLIELENILDQAQEYALEAEIASEEAEEAADETSQSNK